MRSDSQKNHRRSVRLHNYNYRQPGAYFVTICVDKRICLFGEIVNGIMQINNLGKTVQAEWLRTPAIRPQIILDEYVVVPNHFHAILTIDDSRRGVWQYAPTVLERRLRSASQTLGAIVRGFKSAVAKQINEIRQTPGAPVWQRNYYEHVIRDDRELSRIRQYIANNPSQWELDRENPNIEQLPHRGIGQRAAIDEIESMCGGIRP